jgi:hypothetical protein
MKLISIVANFACPADEVDGCLQLPIAKPMLLFPVANEACSCTNRDAQYVYPHHKVSVKVHYHLDANPSAAKAEQALSGHGFA